MKEARCCLELIGPPEKRVVLQLLNLLRQEEGWGNYHHFFLLRKRRRRLISSVRFLVLVYHSHSLNKSIRVMLHKNMISLALNKFLRESKNLVKQVINRHIIRHIITSKQMTIRAFTAGVVASHPHLSLNQSTFSRKVEVRKSCSHFL